MDLFHGVDVSLLAKADNSTRESGRSKYGNLHFRLSGITYHDLESYFVNADLLHLGKELYLLPASIPRLAGACAHHGEIDARTSREDYIRPVPCLATRQCLHLHTTLHSLLEIQYFAMVDRMSDLHADYTSQRTRRSLSDQVDTSTKRRDRSHFFCPSAFEFVYLEFLGGGGSR